MAPDPFGIGEAMLHGLRMFLHGQRRSGRDTALISMVQEGDLILVSMTPVKHHLTRLLRDEGFKDVDVAVIDPRSALDILDSVHSTRRRVLLHHTIYESFYSYAMDYANMEMARTREELDRRHESRRQPTHEEMINAIGGDMSIAGEPEYVYRRNED